MACTPDFARLDAIVKKLEDNDEDIRQIAIDFPHSEPASRSRRLLVDESFMIVQTERKEAVAALKSLQPKWEAQISALELERVCLRKAREEAQAEKVSLEKEKDDLQEQMSNYQRRSLDLDVSVQKREDVVAKQEQALRKAYGEIAKAYGDVTKAMGGKPFDQTLIQSPRKSQANVIVAEQPKQPVHTVSELEQPVLRVNDNTLGEEAITTEDNRAVSQSVNHGPGRIVDHLEAKQLSLPPPSRRPSKRLTEADWTDRESTRKRRNPSRRCKKSCPESKGTESEIKGLCAPPPPSPPATTTHQLTTTLPRSHHQLRSFAKSSRGTFVF